MKMVLVLVTILNVVVTVVFSASVRVAFVIDLTFPCFAFVAFVAGVAFVVAIAMMFTPCCDVVGIANNYACHFNLSSIYSHEKIATNELYYVQARLAFHAVP